MNIQTLLVTARNAVIECESKTNFEMEKEYAVYVNGAFYGMTGYVVSGIYNLKPDTDYTVEVRDGENILGSVSFHTKYEFVTLNVKDFGAKGDGIHDDTHFIQAAIMACPSDSRVLFPKGVYRVVSLFLKDNINIELEKGCIIKAFTKRAKFPVLKGRIESYDETAEYNLGTWEGNPLDMFSSVITGINVKNVVLYGQGIVDGNGAWGPDNWWDNCKVRNGAWRPRSVYLNRCENIVMEGITVQNSPSWTIHPYFSNNLTFLNLKLKNPKVSPNTDALDPESCKNVNIIGVHFSVGDDCIAIKSGKIYMGSTYKVPSENIMVRQCKMQDGHGSVTIGSEMAGGVKNVTIRDCIFQDTDRGLRIKTRRGRGKDAIIDNILFDNIQMNGVMTPVVINSFYYCDPDGHTSYVQTKEPLPVDERTPDIRKLAFRNITAKDCHVAAAYMYGLPEQKIEEIVFENVSISYAEDPVMDVPAMMDDLLPCCKKGMYANNIKHLVLRSCTITGQDGEAFELYNIDNLDQA